MLYFSHDTFFERFVSSRPLSGKISTRAKSWTKEQTTIPELEHTNSRRTTDSAV